jgi:acyl-CoA synthetase (AMP-forming)/AMP-acid ligase II
MPDVGTLVDLLDASATTEGPLPFLTCGVQTRTFGELSHRSRLVAGGLLSLGLALGDRVAVLAENSAEYVEVLFACQRLGLIFVPLNSYLRGEFLRQQLEDARPGAIFVDALGHASLSEVTGHHVEHVILVGDNDGGRGTCTYDNLTVAGDWTACGLNMGCVEAAVMTISRSVGVASFRIPVSCVIEFSSSRNLVHKVQSAETSNE